VRQSGNRPGITRLTSLRPRQRLQLLAAWQSTAHPLRVQKGPRPRPEAQTCCGVEGAPTKAITLFVVRVGRKPGLLTGTLSSLLATSAVQARVALELELELLPM
jgi:hypothetical protein